MQGKEVTRLLFKHGADANAPNFDGQTPLRWISALRCEGAARVLLEQGAYIHTRDDKGQTLFMEARDDVVQLLSE